MRKMRQNKQVPDFCRLATEIHCQLFPAITVAGSAGASQLSWSGGRTTLHRRATLRQTIICAYIRN